MTTFRQKEFGRYGKIIKESALKNVSNPLALASLGVGTASLMTARANRKENQKIRQESAVNSQKQLQAMNRLTSALTGVEETMKSQYQGTPGKPKDKEEEESILTSITKKFTPKKTTPEKKKKDRMKFLGMFSERSYASPEVDNLIQKTLRGASLGATVGVIGSGYNAIKDREVKFQEAKKLVASTTLIGATLGLLVGVIQGIDQKISQKGIYPGNFIDSITKALGQLGYKRDKNYTLNPKIANDLRTKVCVVISRSSEDLKLLINTFDDPKFKEITSEILRGLPKTAVTTEKTSNRYNELSISTLSKGSKDPVFIVNIIEMFIKAGFPVYIVEVG